MCLTIWLARRSAAKFKNVFISLKQEQSFPNDPIYNDSQNCKVPKNTCNKRGASPIEINLWNFRKAHTFFKAYFTRSEKSWTTETFKLSVIQTEPPHC